MLSFKLQKQNYGCFVLYLGIEICHEFAREEYIVWINDLYSLEIAQNKS